MFFSISLTLTHTHTHTHTLTIILLSKQELRIKLNLGFFAFSRSGGLYRFGGCIGGGGRISAVGQEGRNKLRYVGVQVGRFQRPGLGLVQRSYLKKKRLCVAEISLIIRSSYRFLFNVDELRQLFFFILRIRIRIKKGVSVLELL